MKLRRTSPNQVTLQVIKDLLSVILNQHSEEYNRNAAVNVRINIARIVFCNLDLDSLPILFIGSLPQLIVILIH